MFFLPALPSIVQASPFQIHLVDGGITSLKLQDDPFGTEFIEPGKRLGELRVRYRPVGGSDWKASSEAQNGDLSVSERFTEEGDRLEWSISCKNVSSSPVEVGDLALVLPFNTHYGTNRDDTYTKKLVRHSFVGENGTFSFWMRANGVGPYLLMMPEGDCAPEFFDTQKGEFEIYLHSKTAGEDLKKLGGTWRMPNTSLLLEPGRSKTYRFQFLWVKEYEGIRNALADNGGVDVNVAPGMTVPNDSTVSLSLKSKLPIRSLEPEFPSETAVEKAAFKGAGFKIHFRHLGENTVWVSYGNKKRMPLEFFVTDPVETLIKKRTHFLTTREQHHDPTKWYDGLYSQWDMKNRVLRSPDDRDTLQAYSVASDDPILGRAPFIAYKNTFYPDAKEVESVEGYIRHYVWGGLQQRTDEPYPYSIYGINNWKQLRSSPDEGTKGKKHLWRIYDYPNVFSMYYYMYLVEKRYPKLVHYLDAEGYLKRAYGTAIAYFTIPNELIQWSAYDTGTYNEIVIPPLIEALISEGMTAEAENLRGHWEKKVATFVNDKPNLFGSEYAFDSTGFESTEALAHYAMDRLSSPGGASLSKIVAKNEAKTFLDFQMQLNLVCRGVLEPAYYWMGSDYRGSGNTNYTLSYMAQMGGGAIQDYGLYFAPDPAPYLRLGSTSLLSSWALVNTGYWFPGEGNDGAASGGFEPRPWGRAWLGNIAMGRGAWRYSGEIDLGFTGALRSASTVVTDDPVFGEIAYGGELSRKGRWLEVIPKDGLRTRLHVVKGGRRIHIELQSGGFAKNRPIRFEEGLSHFTFALEDRSDADEVATCAVHGLRDGIYQVTTDGKTFQASAKGGALNCSFQVEVKHETLVDIKLLR